MNGFDWFMVAVFGLSLTRWAVSLGAALGDRLARRSRNTPSTGPLPSTTVLIPAYNEEKLITDTLRSVADSDLSRLEILLVDDGSTDETASIADGLTSEIEGLRVIRQGHNLGKARALTTGALEAQGEIVITLDADTRVEPDTIRRLVQAMVAEGAEAVAGNVKVGNRSGWLTRWQALEYVVSLQLERRAQAHLGCITTVPGALGAFRRPALKDAGWFSTDTLAEDTDLTLALQRGRQRIAFCDRARAWTEAPATPGALLKQRIRWLYGNLQCAFKHRAGFAGRSRWSLRLYGLPCFWYGHLFVPLLLPVTAVYLVRLCEWFTWPQIGLGMALLLGIDLGTAVIGLGMDGETKRLLPYVPIQRLIYPFFLWAAFLAVCLRAARGGDRRWNRVQRIGGWLIPKGRSA